MPKLGIRGKGKTSTDKSVEKTSGRARKASSGTPVDPLQKVAYAVIAAGALCVVVLLGSGVTDQMVAAKMRQATTNPSPSAVVGDSNDAKNADETSEADTKRADDADITGDDLDVDAKRDEQDGAAKAPLDLRDATIEIAPGAVVDKKTLTKHLTQMKPEAFLALVASVDRVISETKSGEKGSLEQAYLKAEQKFGSRIDASKRLTLVDELNAVDYKYYVAEKGDTLLYLSQAFGVPLGQLMELNGIGDADKINAGMILLFPLETKQPK